MSDNDPNTDHTLPPRAAPVANGETVAAPPASGGSFAPDPEPVTKSSGGSEPGDETQVKPSDPAVRLSPDGALIIAGYQLSHEIARGGMGVVYAARDLSLDREVAVKIMLPNMSAAEFDRESRITARLPHPGVPPVHALGTTPDGRPFLAMKLIRGETLDALLRARTDPSEGRARLVVVFEQMCQAVGYAHVQGIVHRDLKPSNVMVGAFGEVQVMDWGLAKAVGAADSNATVSDGGAQSEDVTATVAGQVKGTPAYMAPEQARGEPVDARADVFALGGILAAVLTGKPPFAGDSVMDTIIHAASAELDDIFARLDECGADAELVGLAKQCLAARAGDRPASGEVVAAAVAAYRDGADSRLRAAERDRAVGVAEAREQRKRRKVQLAFAGVVVLVLAGAGVATALVIEQRTADKLAAEQKQSDERVEAGKRLADERVAAEEKRLADLRATDLKAVAGLKAADAESQRQQRAVRAGSLVQALGSADTAGVGRIITDLAEVWELARPKVIELAREPVTTKPGLHARLALLADEPARANELAAYLPVCKPEELPTIRAALKPHGGAVSPGLWAVLTDPKADAGERVRAACALAGLAPDDKRWATVATDVAAAAVKATPGEFVVWSAALEPVGGVLVPALMKRYPTARAKIVSGKLAVSELAGEVSGYDLTANLLARYTADRPRELAEMAVLADLRHYKEFAAALTANKAGVVPVLKVELAKKPPEKLADAELDAAIEAHGKRKGHAAAVLIALGEAESVWPVFAFPADGDPTARSYLQERLAAIGADPSVLVRRFDAEGEVSAKRALLIALGDFPAEAVPAGVREPFVSRLLVLYRDDPDSGLHSAIDWLLGQKWGKAKELAAIDAELAREARGRVAARTLAGAAPTLPFGAVIGPQLPAPRVAASKDWYVNGEGQTYAVVRGPVEFTLGSPPSEPGRIELNEPLHRKRIPRTFAIASKEVTVEQFTREFRPKHSWTKQYSPGRDTPIVSVTWYDCAAYCNWLSAREGIPPDQWCYEPNKDGEFDEGMRMKAGHLKLTGYRLPTEAEWEFGCRGGAVTARYHGRGEGLLPRYGWFFSNGDNRSWPVGGLRPNELGLFDMLGNALEWVEDPVVLNVTGQKDDVGNSKIALIDERMSRHMRGGSFDSHPVSLRSADRIDDRPGNRNSTVGFRPVRTLLD